MKTFSPSHMTFSFIMDPVWASFTQTQRRNWSASKNMLHTQILDLPVQAHTQYLLPKCADDIEDFEKLFYSTPTFVKTKQTAPIWPSLSMSCKAHQDSQSDITDTACCNLHLREEWCAGQRQGSIMHRHSIFEPRQQARAALSCDSQLVSNVSRHKFQSTDTVSY